MTPGDKMKHKDTGSLRFGTKAANLQAASSTVSTAKVPAQVIITHEAFRSDANAAVEQVMAEDWSGQPLAVRSSCLGEDSEGQSQAGAYDTELNIKGRDAILMAIEKIFSSYPVAHAQNEVLIQPMIENVVCAGVAFSIDPNSCAPYVTINYSTSGDTDSVTAGGIEGSNIYRWHRSGVLPAQKPFDKVIALTEELETLFGCGHLDVEFAITCGGDLYLLQVRPITRTADILPALEPHTEVLRTVNKRFLALANQNPFLLGDKVVLGVMPDWNPAEIIGPRPRPLALSLYRELITDSIWAYQRNNYGYRNLRSCPLLVDFMGLPYVDVRVSFNSFLPKSLNTKIATKLANHYLDTLINNPALHDKVEFEILLSCFSFDIDDKLMALPDDRFTDNDRAAIRTALKDLTCAIIHTDTALWKKDLAKLEILAERREMIQNSDMEKSAKIYWLLEDCKRYGTLPFAGLARAAFIAVQMLRSIESVGILSKDEGDAFLRSVETVTSGMTDDFQNLPRADLAAKYGHLRPGTYDILSQRYDAAFDEYFHRDGDGQDSAPDQSSPFSLTIGQLNRIEAMIRDLDLPFSVVEMLNFMTGSIEGREYAKFEFTKNLSAAIELFADLGTEHGYSREDLSFANIDVIYDLYRSSNTPKDLLTQSISKGREIFSKGKQINLPQLFWETDAIWHHNAPNTRGNFVSNQSVIATLRDCDRNKDLKGCIVKMLNADPGFDWVFSRGIAGFITAYGGVNSHMAIRARELNIPAAIGIGENQYADLQEGMTVRMDCSSEMITHVR